MVESVLVMVKAVPGSRRDEVVGWLGERLKIRVSAPPEDGEANDAICTLLARELGLRVSAITIARGHGTPAKTVQISGATLEQVLAKWPRD